MQRRDLVLAALATSNGAPFMPVHVQKLLFLLDKNIATAVGGPHFAFRPYAYGPFDSTVYAELEQLAQAQLVQIDSSLGTNRRVYRLTPQGQIEGNAILAGMEKEVREYVGALSDWVRKLTFAQLVSWIYEKYPEMKVNSVFRG